MRMWTKTADGRMLDSVASPLAEGQRYELYSPEDPNLPPEGKAVINPRKDYVANGPNGWEAVSDQELFRVNNGF